MNKKKGIVIGVLSLMVTMMVGYAIFSEAITINGTATAKGDFDITYTCELLTSDNATQGEKNTFVLTTEGASGTCTVEGQTITTTSNLNKPTDVVAYRVKLTNSGSIPAVLKTVDSDNNKTSSGTGPGDVFYLNETYYLAAQYLMAKLDADGNIIGDVGTYCESDSDCITKALTLEPGESMNAYIAYGWLDSDSSIQPKLPEEGVNMTYNVTLGFEQIQAQ